MVRTVSGHVLPVRTEPRVTSSRMDVTVSLDGRDCCAMRHVLRGRMESDVIAFVPVSMEGHVIT